jgi:steroid delta-isomerase-like uncharacterized protein
VSDRPETNIKISHGLLDAWSNKTPDVLDEVCGPEWTDHDPAFPFKDLRGPDAAKAVLALYEVAFPDLNVIIEDAFSAEDKVCTRWIFEGTQTGDLPDLPATGRPFSVKGITVDRIEDGKLAESWSMWDVSAFAQQLGIAPPVE